MGKVNRCLKCVFIFFNLLFVIIGGVLFYVLMRLSSNKEFAEAGGILLAWFKVFTIGITGMFCEGIWAAYSENVVALKTFAGFMMTGLISMVTSGFSVVAKGNEVKETFNIVFNQYANEIMKHEDVREFLESLQEYVKCCGFLKAEEWGDYIPRSCACYGSSKCTSRPYGTTGPDQVYAKSCMETIIDTVCNIAIGIFFGFSAIALLDLVASVSMIRQIQRPEGSAGQYSMAMKGF